MANMTYNTCPELETKDRTTDFSLYISSLSGCSMTKIDQGEVSALLKEEMAPLIHRKTGSVHSPQELQHRHSKPRSYFVSMRMQTWPEKELRLALHHCPAPAGPLQVFSASITKGIQNRRGVSRGLWIPSWITPNVNKEPPGRMTHLVAEENIWVRSLTLTTELRKSLWEELSLRNALWNGIKRPFSRLLNWSRVERSVTSVGRIKRKSQTREQRMQAPNRSPFVSS